MFSYKIIKHEDTENGTLYALYETTTGDDGETVVMWNAPVNYVFYESLDELVDHINDIHAYVLQVKNGEQEVKNADDVTFVEMTPEWEEDWCCRWDCDCGEDCDCDKEWCGCGEWEWKSLDDEDNTIGGTNLGHHHAHKKEGCCGGHCGCSH